MNQYGKREKNPKPTKPNLENKWKYIPCFIINPLHLLGPQNSQ